MVLNNFFEKIDTEEKAYFLGIVASKGIIRNNNISITMHTEDSYILEKFKDALYLSSPLFYKKHNLLQLTINSKYIIESVCKWLKIKPNTTSYVIQLPKLDSENLIWAFIRGFFDGSGFIKQPGDKKRVPECGIIIYSEKMKKDIKEFCGIKCEESRYDNALKWTGVNALDFLSKIYDGATIFLPRKYNIYLDWCLWNPILKDDKNETNNLFKWQKIHPNAVPPKKVRASDVGYDLTLIEKKETIGNIEMYRTGIRILPDYGWFFMVAPRSSIIKTGYMLANSVGIIDRGYTGEILVPLVKIDKNAPDLKLPARVVQLIPLPVIHFQFVEDNNFENTHRNAGGFGSTGVE